MFTGIIENKGTVKRWSRGGRGRAKILTLVCPAGFSKTLKVGGSVSVHGVCLTVIQKKPRQLSFHVVTETLKRAMLGSLGPGDRVHLELPLKMGARLDGHFVLGHVDGKGKILKVLRGKGGTDLLVGFPKALKAALVEKGSVAANGVSLTIGRV